MNTILARGKKLLGKMTLAAIAIAGIGASFGAATAKADADDFRYRGYRYERPRTEFVVRGYYGPRRVFVGPAYGPYYRSYYRPYYHRPYRYWDRYDHCWRYR